MTKTNKLIVGAVVVLGALYLYDRNRKMRAVAQAKAQAEADAQAKAQGEKQEKALANKRPMGTVGLNTITEII
jgi:hypothetical protein